MPPAILNAGSVMPKSSKICRPRIVNVATIANARTTERRAIPRHVLESRPLVSPTKSGAFAIGFMIAKKARKTVVKCAAELSILAFRIFQCRGSIVHVFTRRVDIMLGEIIGDLTPRRLRADEDM
jgi:hypothetical protein